jgi:hypothetical protein
MTRMPARGASRRLIPVLDFPKRVRSEHGGAIHHGKGVDVRLKRDLGQQLSSFSSRSLMHDTDKIFLIGSSICQFCPPDFWLALIGGAALTRGPVLVLVHAHFSP